MTALQTVQTVRKSSETTVQLSLSDEQYTVSETGAPVGAASPTNGVTYIRLMDEKPSAEHDAKVETLLESRRRRGDTLRAAQRTLPDGARFTGALALYAIDALDGNAVAPLGTAAAQIGTAAQLGTAVVPLVGASVTPLGAVVAPLDSARRSARHCRRFGCGTVRRIARH